MSAGQAKTIIPGEELKTNATKGGKRVVLMNDALMQIGAPIAIELAQTGHNLVIAKPAERLVEKLKGQGAEVVVEGIEQEARTTKASPVDPEADQSVINPAFTREIDHSSVFSLRLGTVF